MASREVVIVHPKTQERYGVPITDPRAKGEGGFKIEYEADNTTPYVAPEPRASRADAPASRPEAKASRADAPVSRGDAPASPAEDKE